MLNKRKLETHGEVYGRSDREESKSEGGAIVVPWTGLSPVEIAIAQLAEILKNQMNEQHS